MNKKYPFGTQAKVIGATAIIMLGVLPLASTASAESGLDLSKGDINIRCFENRHPRGGRVNEYAEPLRRIIVSFRQVILGRHKASAPPQLLR